MPLTYALPMSYIGRKQLPISPSPCISISTGQTCVQPSPTPQSAVSLAAWDEGGCYSPGQKVRQRAIALTLGAAHPIAAPIAQLIAASRAAPSPLQLLYPAMQGRDEGGWMWWVGGRWGRGEVSVWHAIALLDNFLSDPSLLVVSDTSPTKIPSPSPYGTTRRFTRSKGPASWVVCASCPTPSSDSKTLAVCIILFIGKVKNKLTFWGLMAGVLFFRLWQEFTQI